MRRIDLDVGDFERLVNSLTYAISKTKAFDLVLSRFLEYELNEVLDHVTNEHCGDEIAQEIDAILGFIGGSDEQ